MHRLWECIEIQALKSISYAAVVRLSLSTEFLQWQENDPGEGRQG